MRIPLYWLRNQLCCSARNQNPLVGVVVLCSIIGLVGLGGLVASNTNNSSVSNRPSYSQDGSGYGAIPYGKARFKSGRTRQRSLV